MDIVYPVVLRRVSRHPAWSLSACTLITFVGRCGRYTLTTLGRPTRYFLTFSGLLCRFHSVLPSFPSDFSQLHSGLLCLALGIGLSLPNSCRACSDLPSPVEVHDASTSELFFFSAGVVIPFAFCRFNCLMIISACLGSAL